MINSLQILFLRKIKKIGKKTIRKINEDSGAGIVTKDYLFELLSNNGFNFSLDSLNTIYTEAEKEYDFLSDNNIKVANFTEEVFPNLLKEIDNSPTLLYYKGDIGCLNSNPTVAVIGTRTPTNFGYKSGERLGEYLAEHHITVVSGLALGCDSAAHQGTLNKNGKTAAFLAHGLHTIYPKSNRDLGEAILENGGCLVSEYPYGEEIQKYYFVERDRLQSGTSLATVVIETDIKGGTMHTVRYTKEQMRLLYCINHPEPKRTNFSQGNQMLIQNGDAKPISNADDISELIRTVSNIYKNIISSINAEDKININIRLDNNNISSDDVFRCSLKELSTRFKLKSPATIKSHLKKGDFTEWSRKRDFEGLAWSFDESENDFFTKREKSMFDN